MNRSRTFILFALLFLLGCTGYQQVNYAYQKDGVSKPTFTLAGFYNRTGEPLPETDLERTTADFFSRYRLLRSVDRADYALDLTLRQVKTSEYISSPTGESVSVHVRMEAVTAVQDKSGKTVYEKKHSGVAYFTNTGDLSRDLITRNAALEDVLERILLDFIDDFNKTR